MRTTVTVDVEVIRNSLIITCLAISAAKKVPRWIYNYKKDPKFSSLEEHKKDLEKILKEFKEQQSQ